MPLVTRKQATKAIIIKTVLKKHMAHVWRAQRLSKLSTVSPIYYAEGPFCSTRSQLNDRPTQLPVIAADLQPQLHHQPQATASPVPPAHIREVCRTQPDTTAPIIKAEVEEEPLYETRVKSEEVEEEVAKVL
ncbi:hypothetical protein EDB19DRAFT_1825596 [Suillus lakei]|nr:hypothetical protein EDB19DRAFT_1825596 [Suillus lakei]